MSKADDARVKAEEIRERSIQDQAMELVPDAMKTLGKFAKGKKVSGVTPTANVVRSATRDILEMAGGRPETRDPRIGGGEGNVNIFIQQFGSDEARRLAEGGIVRDITPPIPPADRVEKRLGWHQDSGRLNVELETNPRPRTSSKIGYVLVSDL